MSRKFSKIEVKEGPIKVPAEAVLQLTDEQAQDRIDRLTRHDSKNGEYRALGALTFKTGEKFKISAEHVRHIPRRAIVVDGKDPAVALDEKELDKTKPGSVPLADQNKGPEVEKKEAKTKAKLAAEKDAKAKKEEAEKAPEPTPEPAKEPAKAPTENKAG